jgi:guanylate kinase
VRSPSPLTPYASPSKMNRKGILFVTSGPSGTGKTTLCRMIEKGLGIPHSVSYTTRLPRRNEVDGKDYHFVSDSVFDQMIQQKAFVEWAHVHGHRYGTSKSTIEQAIRTGQDLVLDLDTQGALAVKAKEPRSVLIFIDAPHHQMLAERLGKRGTEDDDKIKKRLEQAERERASKDCYDYAIMNINLQKAYEEIVSLIQKERKKLRSS